MQKEINLKKHLNGKSFGMIKNIGYENYFNKSAKPSKQ